MPIQKLTEFLLSSKTDKKSLAVGYFNLGYSYSKLEKYQKAIDAYKEAIEIKLGFHEAYNSMGVSATDISF
jgi:tetratricopeptide (TPR) repeat protein